MKKLVYLSVLCASLIFLGSCSKDGLMNDYDAENLNTELMAEDIEDAPAFEAYTDEPVLVAPKTRTSNNDMTAERLFTFNNLTAIQGLNFTLKNESAGNRYLTATGKSKACTMTNPLFGVGNNQKFYVGTEITSYDYNVYIYSRTAGTPLAIGTIGGKTEQLGTNSGTGLLSSTRFNIIGAQRSGYVVIESNYLTDSHNPNYPYDPIFCRALKADNTTLSFGEYLGDTKWEWLLTPDDTFTVSGIEFADSPNNKITKLADVSVVKSYTNNTYKAYDWNTETFAKDVTETSLFVPTKDINWKLTIPNNTYIRPGIFQGSIDLYPPENLEKTLIHYQTTTESFNKTLTADVSTRRFTVAARTRLDVTYYYAAYDVEVEFLAPITYQDRIAYIKGIWKGRIYVDELIEPLTIERNLDTNVVRTVAASSVLITD